MQKTLCLFFYIFLVIGTETVVAQTSILTKYQDSLISISNDAQVAKDDEKRIERNSLFVKTLVSALKISFSYNFPFDSVRNMTVAHSPDKRFRIFSWYLAMSDGTFRFYGAIQLPTSNGKLNLIPLSDQTDNISNTDEILTSTRWLGARYYDIIQVSPTAKSTYYVLLGWKGKSKILSERIIEVLSFNNEVPIFGKPIFDGVKGSRGENRVIFSYSKFNSMLLKQDKTVNMIVFDHLAPIDPRKKDDLAFYASDSSFDAFKIINGRLKFIENVELLNPPDALDSMYNDPKSFKPPIIN